MNVLQNISVNGVCSFEFRTILHPLLVKFCDSCEPFHFWVLMLAVQSVTITYFKRIFGPSTKAVDRIVFECVILLKDFTDTVYGI
jgi:hypothetical protein